MVNHDYPKCFTHFDAHNKKCHRCDKCVIYCVNIKNRVYINSSNIEENLEWLQANDGKPIIIKFSGMVL